MQFGYLTGISGQDRAISWIDNWKMDIVKGDTCCGAVGKPMIHEGV